MSSEMVISVTSYDKPGIICTVTESINDTGGVVLNLSQTVLDKYFSMILFAKFKKNISSEALKKELMTSLNKFSTDKVEVSVIESKSLSEPSQKPNYASDKELEEEYVLTASSVSRQNIVARISRFCKDNNINILNLYTKTINDLYFMIFFLDTSHVKSMAMIRKQIKKIEDKSPDLKIMLQHYEIFKATNEINIKS